MIEKISKNVYAVEGKREMGFVSFSRNQVYQEGIEQQVAYSQNGKMVSGTIKAWGAMNDLPTQRESLIANNAYLPNLHLVQRNIVLGERFVAFRKIRGTLTEIDMPKSLLDFLPEPFLGDLLEKAANEYVKHLVVPYELVWLKGGELSSLNVLSVRDVRAELQNDMGIVENWFYSNFWVEPTYLAQSRRVLRKIPALARHNWKVLYNPDERRRAGSHLLVSSDMLQNDGYYPIVPLDGAVDWTLLSNMIAYFHRRNLENGMSPRFHITIPENYFFDGLAVEEGTMTEKAAREAEEAEELKFLERFNAMLSGMENVGRTIMTKRKRVLEKEYPGIEIKEINYDMKDTALLGIHEAAQVVLLSNQGVPPALASIQLPKQFGSGSEIRNLLSLYQLLYAPNTRKKLLAIFAALKIIFKIPDDVVFGFVDKNIATLDIAPLGIKENRPNEPQQTTK